MRRGVRVSLAFFGLLIMCGLGVGIYYGTRSPDAASAGASPSRPVKPAPYVAPGKENYRFQEHVGGPLPFEYKVPIEPAALADSLADIIDLGHYPTDDPAPLMAEDRIPAEGYPPLGEQYWHPDKRSFPAFLGGFRAQFLKAMEGTKPVSGLFRQAGAITRSLDAATAAGMLEMHLRTCGPKRIPEALNRLACAYWWAKEWARLDALLDAGLDYKPRSETGNRGT